MIIHSYSKIEQSEEDLDTIYLDPMSGSQYSGHYYYDKEDSISLDQNQVDRLTAAGLVLSPGRWDAAYAKRSLEILNRVTLEEAETYEMDIVKYCFKLAADSGILEISI